MRAGCSASPSADVADINPKRVIERGNRWIKTVRIGGKRSDRVLLLILAFLFVECSCATVGDPVYEFVYSEQRHRVPCMFQPTHAEVDEALKRHADDVRRIESIPGVVRGELVQAPAYWWDPPSCSGRRDITWTIDHIERREPASVIKKRIMTIIGDDVRFHGIPYNILNSGSPF